MGFNCVLIGAGNLATHLGEELKSKGFQIVQVYSRTEESVKTLANKLETAYTTFTNEVTGKADIYFIVLKDSVIEEVLPLINFQNKLVVHCSGTLHLSVLKSYSENYGVLYPLQTFSKKRNVIFSEIPVFIEANSEKNLSIINSIATKLSSEVKVTNSEERRILHVAAVLACNFVNHCYALSEILLEKKGFTFDILQPLIKETADKIRSMSPKKAQTGPAIRFDETIINKHIELLSDNTELANLYKTISKSIFNLYQKPE
jgi:predicted short-subunit dehydrogenase-like oxidoreductase (DUF2520 family)